MTTIPADSVNPNPPVIMFTAPNPSPKTLEGTHTYVLGRDQAYIVDPGPYSPPYQDLLARWARENDRKVQGILLTHGHPDHAPGAVYLKSLLKIAVWASKNMADEQTENFGVDRRFGDTTFFPVDGDRLRVIATPGHSADHVAFWLEGARILFSGDTILGQGSTLVAPPEGDMADYMRSLEELRQLRPRLIAPGHGPIVTDPEAKIEEYIRHRNDREEQLLQALGQGPATEDELVSRVYADVDPAVLPLASGSVQAQLAKLVAEGKLIQSGDRYRRPEPPR